MSAFVSTKVARIPFLYAAGRFYYKLGLSDYREFPLLRFGFNGNPYLDPHSATLLPNGLGENHEGEKGSRSGMELTEGQVLLQAIHTSPRGSQKSFLLTQD